MKTLSLSIAVFLFASPLLAQSRMYTLRSKVKQIFGGSVAGAGDANADGYPDFIIGGTARPGSAFNAWLYSGRDGTLIHAFPAKPASLDTSLALVKGAGDVNRDGHADVILGMMRDSKNGKSSGAVRVYSGKDGKLLYSFHGAKSLDAFGFSVNGIGDANRDGYADFIAADLSFWGAGPFVRVYSGKNGSILHTVSAKRAQQLLFPQDVGPAGDLDRDGFADFLIGYSGRWVEVYSGKTGKLLRLFQGTRASGPLEGHACLVGDANRDGFPDYLAFAGSSSNSVSKGVVLVFSGKDGSILHSIPASGRTGLGGVTVSRYGDLNRDGHDDLAIVMGTTPRMLKIYSGKDASLLLTLPFGAVTRTAIAGLGDLNRDGVPDFIANSFFAERADVFSAKTLQLTSDVHLLSLASGGTQSLRLDAGPAEAKRNYWVLGSISGTRPGIKLGSLVLPLNFDGYTELTLAFPNSALLVSTMGRLDSKGSAMAAFRLPPGLSPVLQGLTLHHAFLTFTASSFRTASNAVPLTLVR